MSDVIALEHGLDIGGESLDIISLTEEEADAADSQEFDSLKAYGAAAGDMVVFLQVCCHLTYQRPQDLAAPNQSE